jgi:hypothetical protein
MSCWQQLEVAEWHRFAAASDFENNSGQSNTNSESTLPFSTDYALQKSGLWSDVALRLCMERTGFDDKRLQPQAEYCIYEDKIHGLYKPCLERSQNCENRLFSFIMYVVCPPVRQYVSPHGTNRLPLDGFSWNLFVCFFDATTHCGCIFHSPVADFSLLEFEVSWSHTRTHYSQ